jgi:hypothetical protein
VLGVPLGIGAPALAAVLWGPTAAPFLVFESEPLRLVTKLLVLGSGCATGYVGPFARRTG